MLVEQCLLLYSGMDDELKGKGRLIEAIVSLELCWFEMVLTGVNKAGWLGLELSHPSGLCLLMLS